EFDHIYTSLTRGEGIQELKQMILKKLENRIDLSARPHAVIGERHREILVEAEKELDTGLELMKSGRDDQVVLAASHLREGLKGIGSATGKVYEEELLDNIFSRFCVGK
ncbi:MAG: hypothetical protein AAF492_22160, partial [Verrucomicrobiota bacterium]